MKVKALTSIAGPGYSLAPGQVGDMPADEAKRMIAAGYAAAVEPKKRTAAVKAQETR